MKFLSLFSGIGAPESAFKRIGYDINLVNYCEIDKYASKSYSAIHNVPESLNLWDVTKINPHELPDFDMVFHGSPCQSFSVAGKGDGGAKDSGTRSSLMWYTVEIVKVKQPKVVMWENVKGVLSKKHRETFDEYLNEMAHLGYNNYWKLLNTKDYGVPQNRERVFVISIRKDADIFADRLDGFPWKEKFDNGLRLKDFLEQNVDEKYYLKSNKISKINNSNFNSEKKMIQYGDTCSTILARDYKDPKCVPVKEYSNTIRSGGRGSPDRHQWDMVVEPNECNCIGRLEDINGHDYLKRVYSKEGCSPTLPTGTGGNHQPKILEDFYKAREPRIFDECPTLRSERNGLKVLEPFIVASRGRNPENPSDRTTGSPTEQRLEPNTQGTTNTLTSVQKDNLLVEPPAFRIRKLTPKECWRLQGFSDDDFNKAAEHVSNTQLYKQAGNSITVDVLVYIFAELVKMFEVEDLMTWLSS